MFAKSCFLRIVSDKSYRFLKKTAKSSKDIRIVIYKSARFVRQVCCPDDVNYAYILSIAFKKKSLKNAILSASKKYPVRLYPRLRLRRCGLGGPWHSARLLLYCPHGPSTRRDIGPARAAESLRSPGQRWRFGEPGHGLGMQILRSI